MMSTTRTLGEVAHLLMGQSPDGNTYNEEGKGLPFFQGKTEFGDVYPTTRKWCSAPVKIAEEGDILISVRAPVGPTNLAAERCCIGRGLAAIRPNIHLIERDYLWLYLQFAQPILVSKGQGSTFEAISGPELSSLNVILPRLTEQHRIATHLKAQLAAVKVARNAAQSQLNEAIFLARRVKEKVLSGLSEIKRVPLGNLLIGIESGKSFQTSDRIAKENELGVLKVSAVSWAEFKPQEAKAIDGTYAPDERHRVKAGDLLITRANTVELVGAVVHVVRDYPNRLLSDKTLRLVLDEKLVLPEYLIQVLRMPEARTHIEDNATGTSDSMRNISQGTIRSIPIPLPNINEQVVLAERLNQIDSEMKTLMLASRAQLREIEKLPSRLLAQAFES